MRASRKLIWTSVGVSSALIVATVLAVPWVADRALIRAAQTKGWDLHTSGGRVGLRGIWFSAIKVDVHRDATMHAELGPVCLGWSSIFGGRRVSVGSGFVRLSGSSEQLRALVRAPSNGPEPSKPKRDTSHVDLHHLSVEWRKQDGEVPLLAIQGLELEKSEDRVALRIPLLQARHGAAWLELRDIALEPTSLQPESKASSNTPFHLSASEVAVKYDSSASPKSTNKASDPAPSSLASATPRAAHASPHVSAKVMASTPGHDKPDIASEHADHEAGGKRELLPLLSVLLDEAEQLRGSLATQQPDSKEQVQRWLEQIPVASSFDAAAFRIRLVDDAQKLDLGPWPLKGVRQPSDLRIALSQSAQATQAALAAELTIADRLEHARLKFEVGPIALPQLGIMDGDFGLENIAATELKLEAFAELQAKSGEISIESKGRVARLSLRQPFLARQTIKNVGFEWEGAASLNSVTRQLKSDKLRLSVGAVSARMSGSIELGRDYHAINGSLEVPLAACQDLFNALPVGLAPLLQGWHVSGNFAAQSSVSFDARQPQKSAVRVKIDNGCRVHSVPYEVSPARFEQPFVLDVENEQGIFEPSSFGPGTWGYTPLAAISPYIESAVLVCEDGRFLHHDGFDREAIQNSVRENLRAGRFARGASTISMQLAKNLYLRRDKTIARKLQEAALTMLLEQSFSKRQLLELYLNVIEFGPGLYGIGPAAKHYFETTPDRLSLAQSFFLISILPNPKLSHFGPDGRVHAGRMKYLRMLMTIAQKRGHFSQAELDAGLEEQLTFRVPGNPGIAPSHRIFEEPGAGLEDELSLPELPDE